MIWTLLVFAISLYVLKKVVFPRIQEALDKRQHAIEESIDAAERTRKEADELLAEYRERLAAGARAGRGDRRPRPQGRPRRPRPRRSTTAKAKREEMLEQTKREIQAETRRAIQDIRNEVADLTILATEKVTRKTLTEDDQRRLVEEALSELDFSALAGRAGAADAMEEIAEVYGRSLFAVAQEHDKLDDDPRAARAVRRRAAGQPRPGGLLLLAVLLDAREEGRPRRRPLEGADETLINFLELLIEKHRMPAVFRIRRYYDGLWEQENKILPVQISTATELDDRHRQADRRPHRQGHRPEDRAHRGRRPRHPRRHRPAGRQLDPRRLDPQPPRQPEKARRPRRLTPPRAPRS